MKAVHLFRRIATWMVVVLSSPVTKVRKHAKAVRFFGDATRAENNGDYQHAAVLFEKALLEFKQVGGQRKMKSRIIDKLKMLRTVTNYENEQHFVRADNSWIV